MTGASKGIGASIAESFSAEGATVVVNYASSKAGADAVVKRITEKGGKALAIQADISKPRISSVSSSKPSRHTEHWMCW